MRVLTIILANEIKKKLYQPTQINLYFFILYFSKILLTVFFRSE